ncbi:metal-sulfur cluster assembly factor [Sulfurospirillum arcachonense]|uniref:metal-sulfur cluster assembly factor n=1 Tax=Sulfurospirillum arcachonense TaxID=57666 RepID=UPI00046A993E|nr:iron-sulfur cluster assembly protein [Sulfurospirillum arcachonense]
MNKEKLNDKVIEELKKVYDPELPLNLYDMGLFYNIDFGEESDGKIACQITMTLTSPGCPVSEHLVNRVYEVIGTIPELDNVYVELTFEPPWNESMMSEDARIQMAMM